MNAIPFVVIFISVIAIAWSSLMYSMISIKKSTNALILHNKSLYQVCDQLEKELFRKTKKDNKEEKTKSDRVNKTYKSTRIGTQKESSKLFVSKAPHKMMITAFENLLEELYKESPFYDRRLITRISDELFPLITEDFEWSDLQFKDPIDQEVWYKMLRGDGCPKFTQYISLTPNPALIYARYASTPVLKALFGEEATKEILIKEQEKYYEEPDKSSKLNEEEFTDILSNHNKSEMKSYCSFAASPKVPKVIEGTDPNIQLAIKMTSNAAQVNVED